MSEILVAVDGSKYSEKIVEAACNLASRMNAKVVLLYVSKDPNVVNDYIEFGGRTPEGSAEKYVATAESIMTKLVGLADRKGLSSEVLLESGSAAEKIVTIAAERKSDMIVVGLSGLHGVEKIRSLGSVSRRVLESSHCPVLVVSRD